VSEWSSFGDTPPHTADLCVVWAGTVYSHSAYLAYRDENGMWTTGINQEEITGVLCWLVLPDTLF